MTTNLFRPAHNYRWQDVDVLEYKDDGSAPFKEVTRQVLLSIPSWPASGAILKCSPAATRHWSAISTSTPS
ncbi:MAG: hypothetical protein R3A44_41815 [Caldilineaceae bacterium]